MGAGIILATSGETVKESSDSAPRVILSHPQHNTIYRLSRTVPRESQLIEVRAVPQALHGIAQVRLYADEQLLVALDTAPFTTLWQLSLGVHHFRAEAVVPSGEVFSSQTVDITVLNP
jgi:hypothetical protein